MGLALPTGPSPTPWPTALACGRGAQVGVVSVTNTIQHLAAVQVVTCGDHAVPFRRRPHCPRRRRGQEPTRRPRGGPGHRDTSVPAMGFQHRVG